MKVVKDKNGQIINFGDWDYQERPVKRTEPLTQAQVMEMKLNEQDPECVYDDDGNVITEVTNPLPEGAYEEEHEVVEAPDGGLCLATDHTRLRQYPPIEEQLDYIYHHGVDKWKTDMIDPVKEAHPKAT